MKEVDDIEKDLDDLMCNDIDAASVNHTVIRVNDILKTTVKTVGFMKDKYKPTVKGKRSVKEKEK